MLTGCKLQMALLRPLIGAFLISGDVSLNCNDEESYPECYPEKLKTLKNAKSQFLGRPTCVQLTAFITIIGRDSKI